MAIDPSIPLQAKTYQLQVPNQLEQYGRVQSIKADQLALQEGQRKVQTQNAFRNALASGADLNDPAVVNKLMAIDPTAAMTLQKQQGELKKTNFQTSELGHKVLMQKLGVLAANPSDEAVGASLRKSVDLGLISREAAKSQLQHVMRMSLEERSRFFTNTAIDANTRYKGGIANLDRNSRERIAAANRAVTVQGQNMAGQVAAETERGKLLAKQQAAAPAAIATAIEAIRKIDEMIGSVDGKIKQHPGFGTVGLNFFGRHIPGTPSSDFKIRHEEVTGQAFMQAYTTLKGSGQITEKEGEKATAAITRMNLSQSEAEYKRAAREFQAVLRAGIRRAEQTLGQNTARPSGGATVDFNSLK